MHITAAIAKLKQSLFYYVGREGKTDIILKYGRVRNEWILVWELISI